QRGTKRAVTDTTFVKKVPFASVCFVFDRAGGWNTLSEIGKERSASTQYDRSTV
uniref:Uncharacterized protein n=1 Tax=Anopheles quadriannulatus TaxID=34691 RepID=A0A182XRM8_ANOQN